MTLRHLATYLNDHLAGSVVALELLAHLEATHGDTGLGQTLTALRAEIEVDRDVLETIIARVGGAESRPRQAAAWLAEKFAQLKLTLDDSAEGAMRLFEGLEVVSLGIEGKRSLWQALAVVAPSTPALQGIDYGRLISRAEEQRDRVEAERLRVAATALAKES